MDIEALVNDLPDEIIDYIGGLQEQTESLQKRLDEIEAETEEDLDPIEKALSEAPAEFVELWKADRTRLEQLEKETERARIAKADATWTDKARAFDGIVKAEEFGPTLRRVAEYLPEDAEAITKALTAAAEQHRTADIFKELGTSASGTTDSETQIEAIAKSFQEADPKMGDDEARALAWERNPELYNQYVAERRS